MTKEITPNTNPEVTRVFIVRHGKTEWNDKKIFQGHIDIDINQDGLEQAEKVGTHLKSIPIDDCVSSDLVRCRNTVKEITKHQDSPLYLETSDLRERHMGDLQGMRLVDVLEKYGPNFRSVGEHESILIERVSLVYDAQLKRAQLHGHKNVLLCTHGGVIVAFTNHLYKDRNYALGEGVAAEDLRVPFNTSVTVLDIEKATGQGTIVKFGNTEHLGGDFSVKNQALR